VKKLTILAIITMLAASYVPALSATQDDTIADRASKYYQTCSVNWNATLSPQMNKNALTSRALCDGYTRGAYDGLRELNSSKLLFEEPDAITVEQVGTITFNYIRQHPEEGNRLTAIVMLEALRAAYPRRNNDQKRKY